MALSGPLWYMPLSTPTKKQGASGRLAGPVLLPSVADTQVGCNVSDCLGSQLSDISSHFCGVSLLHLGEGTCRTLHLRGAGAPTPDSL